MFSRADVDGAQRDSSNIAGSRAAALRTGRQNPGSATAGARASLPGRRWALRAAGG
jgi:hypothetical protein